MVQTVPVLLPSTLNLSLPMSPSYLLSPIRFAGYAIHADCFENLFFSSHNATVRVTPEHVIAKEMQAEDLLVGTGELKNKVALNDLKITRSLFEMVVEEGADFPIYTAAVPKRVETYKGYVTELVPTAEFVNDCEREIIRRDAWDVGAAVAQVSDPVSFPPTFPPVKPFEHSALFWSFIFNKLREQRLSRDVSARKCCGRATEAL